MSARISDRLRIERRGGSFFATVAGIDLATIPDDTWCAVNAAYLEHKVLCVPGQTLSARQFHDFGERFGLIEPHTVTMYHHEEFPGITVLSNRFELGRPKGIRDAGSHWHSDYSYKAIPANATLLYALEVPPEGGDTMFIDLAATYRALPGELKVRLEGLKALHHYRHTKDRNHPEGRWRILNDEQRKQTPEVTHPVVRTHPETGEKSIFVFPGLSSGVRQIVGLEAADSDELLKSLFDHCTQPQFQYRHKWQVGDLVLWDNRCIMHHATTDVLPADQHRTLYRINTKGTVPV